jgi:hypothetical protein
MWAYLVVCNGYNYGAIAPYNRQLFCDIRPFILYLTMNVMDFQYLPSEQSVDLPGFLCLAAYLSVPVVDAFF